MRVLQITPEEEALRGGVRATAEVIARALAAEQGIESDFVAGRRLFAGRAGTGTAPAPWVVLHYVGYGYARRGCPWTLVRTMEGWVRTGQVRRLVTVFHELYASGPPWTSAFWLGPVQRSLGRRLARASHGLVTSVELYRGILAAWSGRDDVVALPVPSAVGEPATVPGSAERAPVLVVFGTPGRRAHAYAEHAELLGAACRALAISEIADVGAPDPAVPDAVAGAPVHRHGILAADAVSRLLLGARAGFLTYPPDLLGKSSVFGAYASHGVVTVCAGRPVRAGGHAPGCVLQAAELGAVLSPEALEARATETLSWYRGHAVSRHAAGLAERLRG